MDDPGMSPFLMQTILLGVINLIYALIVYVIARKRSVNPWGWIIGTMVPFIGFIVFAVFWLLTLLSILDRLNAVERDS